MQWLKIAISNLVHNFSLPSRNHTNNKIGHGMVLLQNLAFPFFAMAEVAMAVPNKRYYIKTANVIVKNRVYIQVL